MLGWEYPPHISGGLGTACQGLTQGLARIGVEVVFLVPHARGDEEAAGIRLLGCRGPAAPAERHAARWIEADAALRPYLDAPRYEHRVARLGATDTTTPSASVVYGPDLFGEVQRYAHAAQALARQEVFDVVHAHDWMTFPAAAAVAREAGVPLAVHVHSCEHDRSGADPDVRIQAIEQQGLRDADAVLCVSHYAARVLLDHYDVDAAKVHVVHNAVQVHAVPPPAVQAPATAARGGRVIEEPIVLFLGRVTFQKGPAWFLLAAARVLREMPGVKFVVAGSGDLLPGMIEAAAALGIGRQVHFTGFLRGADLERMYGMADIYVMPSVSEPFGISPLEAAGRGVPVILSRQSGVAEVLPSAPQVNYWDVEGLAASMLALLRDPALREQHVAQAQAEVAGLKWEAQARVVQHVYEAVLA